jgi:dihydroorotate dehydrogenase
LDLGAFLGHWELVIPERTFWNGLAFLSEPSQDSLRMSWLYRTLVRPVLFSRDSEEIHNETLRGLGWASRHPLLCEAADSFYGAPELPVELFGLKFPNPVGLAAGMDKHAAAAPIWPSFGFGFSELGGVTWHAQPGNPEPRMFRAIDDQALINRMGFNNPGASAMASKLAQWKSLGRWPAHPVGINLGKSKITPLEQAADDYANSLRVLWPYADFFVVNVSSPNTPNLRQLQDKAALDEIFAKLQAVNDELVAGARVSGAVSEKGGVSHPPAHPSSHSQKSGPKPILVKVAPDLSFEALDEILELVGPRRIAGIVATNTTITRPETTDEDLKRVYGETGGLSGRPLGRRSTEVIRHLYRQTRGELPIIGVGGIFNAADAWEKITAGASLVQVYTGMVYEGPGIARELVTGLRERLNEAGLSRLREAVGTRCK